MEGKGAPGVPVTLPAFDPGEVERLLKQLEKEVESGETIEEVKTRSVSKAPRSFFGTDTIFPGSGKIPASYRIFLK
ncbi:hypothetical protein RJ40_05145 [Methanofollis aquaemaris]|uniref:Uncharacterized protein n=1 Tax=Methanofollis aquaemaris TaxID=126734 RepID=A0A8A3S5E1_9EURY|nr:hypothetical protein [Methanofollis aquaemaris]QSZ66920.1 hypothetical protein RJ40_05145 [Methanofollis aquaemaris]